MRTALLAAVSHDLRTPLASIKASVSSLRQTDVEWSEADQADLLATIEQNADRLDALIGNLLDMSRLHTGSLQPFLRPTAIDEVAPAALLGLDDSLRLEMAVPDGFPLVLADPGLLERILANLFSNALRYSPPGRPPELHAELVDDTVLLEVVDHGQGVPDEQKERVFEPFSTYPSARVGQAAARPLSTDPSARVGQAAARPLSTDPSARVGQAAARPLSTDPSARVGQAAARPLTRVGDRHPGVGLGLAVAKGFAEAMGGRIRAKDTPGGGLTVQIALPVASGDKSALGAGS